MLEFRDATAKKFGLELLVHTNEEGVRAGILPWTHGAAYSDIMLTQALRQALDKYGFDAAFGGGRRDEEKSRAKERVFSFRSSQHRWTPRISVPSSGRCTTRARIAAKASVCFPLELDRAGRVAVHPCAEGPHRAAVSGQAPAGGAARRPPHHGRRRPAAPGRDRPRETLQVRFRTLGDYPLTGATLSTARMYPR